MEIKEAVKCIDNVLASDYYYDETLGYQLTSDDIEWLEMAKEALENKIPKRVIISNWSAAKCPTCGEYLSESLGDGYYNHFEHLKICPNEECCQRIVWK